MKKIPEPPDPQPGDFDEELATVDPADVQVVEPADAEPADGPD